MCADLCGRIRDLCGLRIIPVWSLSIPVWPQNYTCVLVGLFSILCGTCGTNVSVNLLLLYFIMYFV